MTPTAIGRRLVLTRRALKMSQKRFAGDAGVKTSTISNAENGKQRIGIDTAIALTLQHDLTLDWIYFGENDGLKQRLVDAMKAVQERKE